MKSAGLGGAGKVHGEGASLAWNTGDPHVATMGAGNGQSQVEAETHSRQGTASISPEKTVKNMRQIVIRNPRAGVLHRENNLVVIALHQGNDPSSLGGIFQGII